MSNRINQSLLVALSMTALLSCEPKGREKGSIALSDGRTIVWNANTIVIHRDGERVAGVGTFTNMSTVAAIAGGRILVTSSIEKGKSEVFETSIFKYGGSGEVRIAKYKNELAPSEVERIDADGNSIGSDIEQK